MTARPLLEQTRMTLLALAAETTGPWWILSGGRYDIAQLAALERRGLVELDRYMGQVRLTPAGRALAAELKGTTA